MAKRGRPANGTLSNVKAKHDEIRAAFQELIKGRKNNGNEACYKLMERYGYSLGGIHRIIYTASNSKERV